MFSRINLWLLLLLFYVYILIFIQTRNARDYRRHFQCDRNWFNNYPIIVENRIIVSSYILIFSRCAHCATSNATRDLRAKVSRFLYRKSFSFFLFLFSLFFFFFLCSSRYEITVLNATTLERDT